MKKVFIICIVLMLLAGTLFARGRSGKKTSAPDPWAWLEEVGEEQLPEVNPLLVSGNVVTAGSSTVAPLAAVIIERYREDGLKEQISIDVIGSGAGFERFTVAGESDIANASRAITQSELTSAANIGRRPISFRVGSDALSVVVARDNAFIGEATTAELALIFGSAERWSDVNPTYPTEPIARYVPGTDSGTFDFFVELVFDEDVEPILSASNIQFSEDDNVLVQGVAGSPYAVAFFGYAYYRENKEELNILTIEGIQPTPDSVGRAQADSIADNIALGGYPLARPLLIYSDAIIMRSRPQVAAYIAYFLHNVDDVIDEVGYFQTNLDTAERTWLEVMSGAY